MFIPYILVMSLFWCGVSVTMNQQYYKPGDTAIITIKGEGYLFNPNINFVEIWAGKYPSYQVPENIGTGYLNFTQVISPDMATSGPAIRPTYVRIVYTPQVWWFSREEYSQILITP